MPSRHSLPVGAIPVSRASTTHRMGSPFPRRSRYQTATCIYPRPAGCGSKATIPMSIAHPDRLASDRKGRNPSPSGMRILPIPCPRTCCAKTNRIIRPTLWTTCTTSPGHPTTTPSSCRPEPKTTVPGTSIADVPVGHRHHLSRVTAHRFIRAVCGIIG